MPSKKKKYNSRFPPARIKKIMQTDEDVGKVAAPVPVIISRALELFIESLILKTSETTQSKNAKTLSATHIKQTIHSEKTFDFLKDLVASVPDHQAEEEADVSTSSRKPRVPRQRKQKDGETGKRKKKKKSSSESSEDEDEDEDDDESTETDEEQESYPTQSTTNPAVPTFPQSTAPAAHSNPPAEPPTYNPASQLPPFNPASIPHASHMSGYAMHLNNNFTSMSQPINLCMKEGGHNSDVPVLQNSGKVFSNSTPQMLPPFPGITPISAVPGGGMMSAIMKAPALASGSSLQEDDDYDT